MQRINFLMSSTDPRAAIIAQLRGFKGRPENHNSGQDVLCRCEDCGQSYDPRDLGDVLHHALMGPGHRKIPVQ